MDVVSILTVGSYTVVHIILNAFHCTFVMGTIYFM